MDDADIGNIVRRHRVKSELQILHVARSVVFGENAVRNGPFTSLFTGAHGFLCGNKLAIEKEHAFIVHCDHLEHLRFLL